jgi:hypothetical protein
MFLYLKKKRSKREGKGGGVRVRGLQGKVGRKRWRSESERESASLSPPLAGKGGGAFFLPFLYLDY